MFERNRQGLPQKQTLPRCCSKYLSRSEAMLTLEWGLQKGFPNCHTQQYPAGMGQHLCHCVTESIWCRHISDFRASSTLIYYWCVGYSPSSNNSSSTMLCSAANSQLPQMNEKTSPKFPCSSRDWHLPHYYVKKDINTTRHLVLDADGNWNCSMWEHLAKKDVVQKDNALVSCCEQLCSAFAHHWKDATFKIKVPALSPLRSKPNTTLNWQNAQWYLN